MRKKVEWIIYMISYSLILISITIIIPNSLYIDKNYYGIWSLIASIIIYILNKTIKPIIVWLTIPITALTLGLFYPFINILILYIVSLILGSHFKIIGGIITTFIVAVLISIITIIIKKIINKIIKGV